VAPGASIRNAFAQTRKRRKVMATAKRAKSRAKSKDPLVVEFSRHILYGTPASYRLLALIDDDENYKQFLEDRSLDPEILEKYERSK
jgi:hypothetical protein